MNPQLKYLPVNWKNGMPFSADHLNQQYAAVLDGQRDTAALYVTDFNYGLLGGSSQTKFSDSFRSIINNEKVEVSYCRAIVQNGARIEILNQNWEELQLPLSELVGSKNLDTSPFWYALLIIDVFERVPEGIEVESESPRRKPNTRPSYHLELLSEKDLQHDNLANAIPIAKFENSHSGLKKVEDYIPPCTRINSHESLFRKYEAYNNYLTEIKDFSEKILVKIKNKRKNREQNHLADDIYALCEAYLDYFAFHYDEYRLVFRDLPPVRLMVFFARLARVLSHEMDKAFNKSHLLQYFNHYATDISVAQINKVFSDPFESAYLHYDINRSLQAIDLFLRNYHAILQNLVRLDYRELAPRDVVKEDRYTSSREEPERKAPQSTRIRIKHSGKEKFLGDDLED